MSNTHYLKTWPEHYYAIESGKKRAELRFNDRDFKEGDFLSLMLFDPDLDQYTNGQSQLFKVTHILHGGQFGLEKGYVMMSLESVPPVNKEGV